MWLLQEANGKNVAGKFQYGQASHAQKRAEKEYGGKLFWEMGDTDYIGKDKREKVWYRIIWQETNPMKNPSLNNQLWRALAGFVVKLRTANRAQLEDALLGAKQGMNDYALSATERALYKSMATILRRELKKFAPKKNPRKPQHWIVTVKDTTNNQKIASTYFDGTMTAAKKYFRKEKTIAAYWGQSGYIITMQPNAIILWDGYVSRNPSHKKNPTKVDDSTYRKSNHPNHAWYVEKLIKAQRVQDHSLVKSLKADLRKMTKIQRDNIMKDFRDGYKAWYDAQRAGGVVVRGGVHPPKKNPSREGSKLYVIFRCIDDKIQFYNGGFPISNKWGTKGQAALYKTKSHAMHVANKFTFSFQVGITHESTTVAEIKKRCKGKA